MSQSRLSAGERRRLLNLLRRTQNARVYKRALAVWEHSHDKSAVAIAEFLYVSRQSVYNWIDRFRYARGMLG